MTHIFRCLLLALGFLASCSGGGGGGSSSNDPVRQENRPPTITSAREAVFPQTRTGTAYRISGADPDGDQLRYSISGDDAGSFSVNETTGEVAFLIAPDVDAPAAADGSNFYIINVTVEDPSGASATQRVDIEVVRHDPQGPFLSVDGAAFIGPDTIIPSDPSTIQSLTYVGITTRTIPDNRVGNDTETEIHIFDARYANGKQFEIVVNTEITPLSAAEAEAERLGRIMGQLDPVLVDDVSVIWVHPGDATISAVQLVGIVVHTGFANDANALGALEEVMAHELVHVSLDADNLRAPEWFQAQKSDVSFITEFAREFPETEDLAESYGAYLIVKRRDRNPPDLVQTIENGIPARLAFFESLGL